MGTMRIHRRGRPPYPGILTPAEQHVLEHLRQGLTNIEIAYRLDISPDGVKYHVSNMLGKLQLPDRYALAAWEPVEEHRARRTRDRAWLPALALPKVAGLALAGIAVVALGVGVVIAAGAGRTEQQVTAPTLAASVFPDYGMHLAVSKVISTTSGSIIDLDIRFTSPIPKGAVAAWDGQDLAITTNTGTVANFPASSRRFDSDDRLSIRYELNLPPLPPRSTTLDVSIANLYINPPGVPRQKHPGPWRATAAIAPKAETDVTAKLPTTTVDTGYGWQYVVDDVEVSEDSIAVKYHIAGDTAGLAPNMAAPPAPATLSAPFPVNGATSNTVVVARTPGATSATIGFGPTLRTHNASATATLTRSSAGWAPALINVGSAPAPVSVQLGQGFDGPTVGVTITTDGLVLSSGALNGGPATPNATLTDDLGNSYTPGGASSSAPPTVTTFDFNGPIHQGATSLTFTIGAYATLETGDWTLTIPLG